MKTMMILLSLIAILAATAQLVTAGDDILKLEAHNGHNGIITDARDFEERLNSASHRELTGGTCDHPGDIHYFEVSIRVEPNVQLKPCVVEDQVLLGHAINLMLLDYGIGQAGADDDSMFLAGVCPQPTTSDRRRLWWSRGFVWKGGGGCRGCFADNNDQRFLLGSARGTSLWFTQEFAPQLQITLENAIEKEIAPDHQTCLGSSPTASVETIEVSLQDLELQCDDGGIMEHLASINLVDVPIQDFECGKCVSIDFSTRGDGSPLYRGNYVSSEWKANHGLTVTANGGYTPGQQARILDTAHNECINAAGSSEFGSPNKNCNNGGIGQGVGGAPGQQGENCVPVGNVLVVQESNKRCPDASQSGGTLTFSFDNPVLLSDIGLMDVDESDQRMIVTYADGVAETFTYSSFGDNSVQRVLASKLNVKKVEVIFPGSGAITEINFCPECSPQTSHDEEHHCLVAGQQILKAEEQIAFDDFENPDEKLALQGWKKGRVDNTEIHHYTTFLGRYGASGMKSPYKTFSVPWKAETIVFELDFYPLSSWDLDLDPQIFVGGEQIRPVLAFSFSADDIAHLEGTTTNGIKWVCNSLGPPEDRIHHFTIEVPRTSRLYDDGKLRLLLNAGVPDNQEDKTTGWDNVKVTARYGCAIGRRGPVQQIAAALPSCSNINATLETFEDFEGSDASRGWSNFKLATRERQHFTKFLGLYGSTDSSPEKTFDVPIAAQIIILEVDFYEIDGWDGTRYGGDKAAVYISDQKVDLGTFAAWEDEGQRSGTTSGGISWLMTSLTRPARLGYRYKNKDQKHHLKFEVPRSAGLFNGGKLKVKLHADCTQPRWKESGGWDNLKISSKTNCTPG